MINLYKVAPHFLNPGSAMFFLEFERTQVFFDGIKRKKKTAFIDGLSQIQPSEYLQRRRKNKKQQNIKTLAPDIVRIA